MNSVYRIIFPVYSNSLSEVSGVFAFLKCLSEKVDVGVLADKGTIDEDEFEAKVDYHRSVIGIVGKYLPDDLIYRSPNLMNSFLCDWRGFERELDFLSDLSDSSYWMLAVSFLSDGFLMLPKEIISTWLDSFVKDWAFRSEFAEEKILDRANLGELDAQWMLLTSICSKKTGSKCMIFLTKEVDVFGRVESCCKSLGLITRVDLDF